MSSRNSAEILEDSSAQQSNRNQADRQSNEVDLASVWNGVRRFLPHLLITIASVGTVTYFWSKSKPDVYQASTSLVTTGGSTTLAGNGSNTLVTASPLPQGALQEALQGPIVLNDVIAGIRNDTAISQSERKRLSDTIETELQVQKLKTITLSSRLDYSNSGIYTISAKAATPTAATHLADMTAQALLNWDRGRALSGVRRAERGFKAQLTEIDRQLTEEKLSPLERETLVAARANAQRNLAQTGIQAEGVAGTLDIVAPAVTPRQPIAPRPTRNAVLASLLTLLLGVGIIVLRNALDRTARSEDDLLNFGLPTLGVIPRMKKRDIVFSGIIRAARQVGLYEAIGFLKVNLLSKLGNQPGRLVMVTSTTPGEGKSSLTATLADSLASSKQKVLILDADMRRGTQQEVWDKYENDHTWIQLVGQGGGRTLGEALMNPENVQVIRTETGVDVLPAGAGIQDSLSVLNRPDLKAILESWSQHYDIVLVDSPPLLAIADGLVLGKSMDAVLLVVEEGKTSMQALRRSLRRAEQGKLKLIGFVLNKVSISSQESQVYGYGYGYSPRT